MKRVLKSALCVMLFLPFACCKTQIVPCEDVSSISEISWLKKKSLMGQPLESVDRIVYKTSPEDAARNGYYVSYEPVCCDIPGQFVYDCDGNTVTTYGTIDGCQGECDIIIISRVNIYNR